MNHTVRAEEVNNESGNMRMGSKVIQMKGYQTVLGSQKKAKNNTKKTGVA